MTLDNGNTGRMDGYNDTSSTCHCNRMHGVTKTNKKYSQKCHHHHHLVIKHGRSKKCYICFHTWKDRLLWILHVWTILLLASLQGVKAEIQSQLEYQLLEQSAANFVIGNVSHDSLLRSVYNSSIIEQLQFQLSPTPQVASSRNIGKFAIDSPYGMLRTSQVIDRDSICMMSETCDIPMNVIVQLNQIFHIIKVTVSILDQNDNVPTFPEELVTLAIPETTMVDTPFPLPSAEDSDSQTFGIQDYTLDDDSGMFDLQKAESATGEITGIHLVLAARLDRERQSFYRMKVYAYDGGHPSQTGTLWVEVTVMDVNDNNPTFDRGEYEVNVPEDTPRGTTILSVNAYDPDEGASGQVVYSFADDTPEEYLTIFGIKENSGDVYLKLALDYEQGNNYQFRVIATDMGPNSLPSYAKVIVTVEDVNDHTPQIILNSMSTSGRAEVQENMRPGAFVAHVTIDDPDGGENGRLTCYIDLDGLFYINYLNDEHTELTILTNVMLDRETQDSYVIILTCHDGGIPQRRSAINIPVTVLDDNDFVPVFFQNLYTVSLYENEPPGTIVTRVNATDGDIGRNAAIKYHLLNETDTEILYCDSISGVITTKVAFDYEVETEYEVLVTGTDQGHYAKTTTVTLSIHIMDTNDIKPRFLNSSYAFQVGENDEIGKSLGFIEAVDPDTAPYSQITYLWDPSITDPIPFTLDEQTGEVKIRAEIDREVIAVYHLVALASNEGYTNMFNRVNVTITIKDINDNWPVINFPSRYNNTINVYIGTKVGSIIGEIDAYDNDAGPNSYLVHSLSNGNDTFTIDPNSGKIILSSSLSGLDNEVFRLEVTVHDSGTPALASTADLNIVITTTLISPQARADSDFFSGSSFIILIVVITFIILMIIITAIVVTARRKGGANRKKPQYPLRVTTDRDDSTDDNLSKDEYHDDRPNGHVILSDSERQKKEVKFVVDIGRAPGETDDYHMMWPQAIEKPIIEATRSRNRDLAPYMRRNPISRVRAWLKPVMSLAYTHSKTVPTAGEHCLLLANGLGLKTLAFPYYASAGDVNKVISMHFPKMQKGGGVVILAKDNNSENADLKFVYDGCLSAEELRLLPAGTVYIRPKEKDLAMDEELSSESILEMKPCFHCGVNVPSDSLRKHLQDCIPSHNMELPMMAVHQSGRPNAPSRSSSLAISRASSLMMPMTTISYDSHRMTSSNPGMINASFDSSSSYMSQPSIVPVDSSMTESDADTDNSNIPVVTQFGRQNRPVYRRPPPRNSGYGPRRNSDLVLSPTRGPSYRNSDTGVFRTASNSNCISDSEVINPRSLLRTFHPIRRPPSRVSRYTNGVPGGQNERTPTNSHTSLHRRSLVDSDTGLSEGFSERSQTISEISSLNLVSSDQRIPDSDTGVSSGTTSPNLPRDTFFSLAPIPDVHSPRSSPSSSPKSSPKMIKSDFPSNVSHTSSSSSLNLRSVLMCVAETVQETKKIHDPVEILRIYQQKIMMGRPLDLSDDSSNIEGETSQLRVSRYRIFEDAMDEFTQQEINLRVPLEVIFYGEEAADYGGPRREFLHLVLKAIQERLFIEGDEGYTLCDNPVSLQKRHYYAAGRLMAASILQNGPLPCFLSPNLIKRLRNPLTVALSPAEMQLHEGLNELGIIQLLNERPVLEFLLIRTAAQPLSRNKLLHLLKPKFSEHGNNKRQKEEASYKFFLQYIKDVQGGKRGDINLEKILLLATGSESEPVLGFTCPPCIIFEEGMAMPSSNTCINQLRLPLNLNRDQEQLYSIFDLAFSTEHFGAV